MKKLILGIFALGSVAAIASQDIAPTDLPKNINQSLQKAFPGSKVVKAEKEKDHFEVKVELKDHSRREVHVNNAGTIVKNEAE